MKPKLILFVFGTRPEAIKLAPVIRAFRADAAFETRICVTAQHRELLDQFLDFFRLRPDIDLNLMSPDQSLPVLTAKAVSGCAEVFERLRPDLVFVQGDTTSAFSAALAANLCQMPVAHIEAGLRSHQKSAPFPEETNRVLIGSLADLHFAPGDGAGGNLRREGITSGVHVVGNTVVDTLRLTLAETALSCDARCREKFPAAQARRVLLLTLHRRENFGQPLADVCAAVRDIAAASDGVEVFCPVHPNPRVRQLVREALGGMKNIHLLEPLSYADFIWLLCRAALVISDSGGVLEEAETLGRPVLVARETTERAEAMHANGARLVGSSRERIFTEAMAVLDGDAHGAFDARAPLRGTFGDGEAASRILRITREYLAASGRRGRDRPDAVLTLAGAA